MDEEVVATPAPAPPPPPAEPAFYQDVEDWFFAYFHNLGDRLDTELFNRFHSAKEELKQTLLAHLK